MYIIAISKQVNFKIIIYKLSFCVSKNLDGINEKKTGIIKKKRECWMCTALIAELSENKERKNIIQKGIVSSSVLDSKKEKSLAETL